MTEPPERRRQRRRNDRVALVFHYAQERCEVNTMDISRSGALIRTPITFPSGTLLILEAPGMCAEGEVRLLARVVRGSQGRGDIGTSYSGLGLLWIRAYSSAGPSPLREFLEDVLGFGPDQVGEVKESPSGDAVYDFSPAAAQSRRPGALPRSDELSDYQDQRERLIRLQKDRFRLETPIVYSVHNMHYRGTLISLGNDGMAVATKGALPFLFSRVTVRYPLENTPTSPRVVLFGEAEMILQPFGREPGFFSARIQGIDELDSPGIFKMHLRNLEKDRTRW